MRRYRDRHRKGFRGVRVYLQMVDVEVLIAKGYLNGDSRDDPSAVQGAVNMFVSDMLFVATQQ